MYRCFLALATSLWISTAAANCWQVAASRYHIDPLLLYAIANGRIQPQPQCTQRQPRRQL